MTIPTNPAYGCQAGIVMGVPRRTIMSMGVKGGKRDNQVAKTPVGFCKTGIIRKSGKIIGRLAGNATFWASLLSLHADPRAAYIEPAMTKKKIR